MNEESENFATKLKQAQYLIEHNGRCTDAGCLFSKYYSALNMEILQDAAKAYIMNHLLHSVAKTQDCPFFEKCFTLFQPYIQKIINHQKAGVEINTEDILEEFFAQKVIFAQNFIDKYTQEDIVENLL